MTVSPLKYAYKETIISGMKNETVGEILRKVPVRKHL